MFNNIGKKIKGLATVLCVFGMIAALVAGIVVMVNNIEDDLLFDPYFWIGLGVIIGGSLLSWVGSWIPYGFGQLVNDTSIIKGKLMVNDSLVTPTAKQAPITDSNESGNLEHTTDAETAPKPLMYKCDICGRQFTKVSYVKINTYGNVRYKNVCPDCQEKNAF